VRIIEAPTDPVEAVDYLTRALQLSQDEVLKPWG